MKTLDDIDKTLLEFERKFGLTVRGHQQLSEAWFNLKLGVISASNASKAVAGKTTDTRFTYMAELISQVCTGIQKEIDFKQMEWGRQHESAARSSYEFQHQVRIQPLTFVFKDQNFRAGVSPDGLIMDANKRAVEIKCPWDSANFIKFLLEEKIKPEWNWQAQFNLWVLDADTMDFHQYDPRMKTKPLHTTSVVRDPKMQEQIEETIPEFVRDMDRMLEKIGIQFGEQWHRIARLEKSA